MADSSISFLFNQLSILLQEEQNLLRGFEQEAEDIHHEIGQMRAFLRVADAKEESDPQLKEWVKQVREIAYDSQNVLDQYMFRFPHHEARGFFGYQGTYSNTLQSSSSTNTWYDGRGDALLLEETEVVGIEKPKKQLLEWIWDSEYGFKVISVVGMPGLGKTTLVKKVYDDAMAKNEFNHHLWVTVSESFKIEHLLEEVIKRLVDEAHQPPTRGLEAMYIDNMKEFIKNFLKNEDYIIVLDDIWRINAWEAIKYAFPRSNSSGRGCIIITTRFNDTGFAASNENNGHVYSLKPLSEHESKVLFYKKVFLGNSCPFYLEQICASILQRCEGLPLAIVVIGGLLATKNNRIDEWEMFNCSLGHELEGDNLKRLSKLLSHSFYDLPYYLKACFLYLSVFPKDHHLKKATVIRLWVAEGFVEAKQGMTMEEIAEGYLNELFNRSLIQVTETSHDGRAKSFHIHDLIREYIVSKSRDQNMVVINNQEAIRWPHRIRRLAFHHSINFTQQIHSLKYLRSLLFMGPIDSDCGPILRNILQSQCKLLKVLDLRRAPLKAIPNGVFKLYHLEYLSLRDTAIKLIPKSIGNLQKLETLDLKGSRVTELPIEILKLQRLRNLIVYRYAHYPESDTVQSFKAPYEIGKLSSLQKLCYIDVGEEINGIKLVKEIGKLTLLQRLCITNLRRKDGEDFCSSLANLSKLRSLFVGSVEDEVMDLQYRLNFLLLRTLELKGCLQSVPNWVPSLTALTFLCLAWSKLQEDPLEYLQGLPNLRILNMICAYEGEGLRFKAGGFQSLKRLRVVNMDGLRWVRVEKGSLSQLEKLMLMGCKSMADLPVGFDHLVELEELVLRDMSPEFVQRLSEKKFVHLEKEMEENRAAYIFHFSKKLTQKGIIV